MIEKLREKYKDKIAVKAGMELACRHILFQSMRRAQLIHLTSSFCPFIRQETRNFGQMNIKADVTRQEYNEGYGKELLSVVQNYQANYSGVRMIWILIVRYDSYGVYPFEKLKPLLTEILKTVIKMMEKELKQEYFKS